MPISISLIKELYKSVQESAKEISGVERLVKVLVWGVIFLLSRKITFWFISFFHASKGFFITILAALSGIIFLAITFVSLIQSISYFISLFKEVKI